MTFVLVESFEHHLPVDGQPPCLLLSDDLLVHLHVFTYVIVTATQRIHFQVNGVHLLLGGLVSGDIIIADRADVWNKYPSVPVGAVYLRRVGGQKVEALNVTCPHAGCPVEFKPASGSYLCPCHDSAFKLDGSLANDSSPSPRGMDVLEVEVRHGAEVWVKFQNFEAGTARKIPLA